MRIVSMLIFNHTNITAIIIVLLLGTGLRLASVETCTSDSECSSGLWCCGLS